MVNRYAGNLVSVKMEVFFKFLAFKGLDLLVLVLKGFCLFFTLPVFSESALFGDAFTPF